MSKNNEALLPPVENQDLRTIEDLLTPEEQAELYKDLTEMRKQRVLDAGAVALYFFS